MNNDIKEKDYPSEDILQEWKEKYENIYAVEIEKYKCWLRSPDLKIFKHAFSSLQQSEIDFQNAIINNCWLAGDEIIKENEDYFNALCDQIEELIEIPEYRMQKNGTGYLVNIQDYQCKLRKPTREDIRKAQIKNVRNQPFDTNIFLLESIWIEGDDKIKEKDATYIALLQAVSEIQTNKVATIKKL